VVPALSARLGGRSIHPDDDDDDDDDEFMTVDTTISQRCMDKTIEKQRTMTLMFSESLR
jgi:hypothetical protein